MSYNGRSQKTILQPDDLLRSLAGRNVKDMKIVFLDDNSIGTDIDLSGFEVLGEVVRYGSSKPEEVPDRVQDADVVIVNKMEINEQTVGTARNLKLVCVTATGTNNLDKKFLEERNIAWRNVAGYSTESVAEKKRRFRVIPENQFNFIRHPVHIGRFPLHKCQKIQIISKNRGFFILPRTFE